MISIFFRLSKLSKDGLITVHYIHLGKKWLRKKSKPKKRLPYINGLH